MFKAISARLRQGFRTHPFPVKDPLLPDGYRGRPVIETDLCPPDCGRCLTVCPTEAIAHRKQGLTLDLGRCIFCAECTRECAPGAMRFSNDFRLAGRTRSDLEISGSGRIPLPPMEAPLRRLLGRSLKLRQVSAGGCNACEADTNVLGTLTFDLGRFGIQFVASPRHADGLLITGPVTANMKLALEKTYAAVPSPKIVIAVGACAISGGLFSGHPEAGRGAPEVLPVDLFIPGCPPNPWTILDGLLRLLNFYQI
jgi:Ni,Fe-hydrogenase III small subunit/ferredoxin